MTLQEILRQIFREIEKNIWTAPTGEWTKHAMKLASHAEGFSAWERDGQVVIVKKY